MEGYKRENAWSAPEVLSSKRATEIKLKMSEKSISRNTTSSPTDLSLRQTSKPSMTPYKVDVYSFGFILWELCSEKKPFDENDLKKLIHLVVDEDSRPKVPDNVSCELSALIRKCWNREPEKRPIFPTINNELTTILDKL